MATGREKTDMGARVRDARKKLGLTQEALSELAGVTREFISRLENGKQIARADVAVTLADKIGIDPVFLVRGGSTALHDEFLVRETADVVRRLTLNKRKIVYRLAADLLLDEDEGPPKNR